MVTKRTGRGSFLGKSWYDEPLQEDPEISALKEAKALSKDSVGLTEGDIAEINHNKEFGWPNSDELQKKIDYTEMMLSKEPSLLEEWFPSLRSPYDVERRRIAKEKEKEEYAINSGLDDDPWTKEKWNETNDDIDSGYGTPQGLLEEYESDAADEDYASSLLSESEDDRENYLLRRGKVDFDLIDDDPWSQEKAMEEYNEKMLDAKERHGRESEVSGGMTDNAFGGDSDRKMSPKSQQYALGLLKDMMTPEQDDAPQQVRGAGIIKGSGTPFPSLLQKKPERQYYRNKGLV